MLALEWESGTTSKRNQSSIRQISSATSNVAFKTHESVTRVLGFEGICPYRSYLLCTFLLHMLIHSLLNDYNDERLTASKVLLRVKEEIKAGSLNSPLGTQYPPILVPLLKGCVILLRKHFFLSNLFPQCHHSLTPPKHLVFILFPPPIYPNVIQGSHSSSNPTFYMTPSQTILGQSNLTLEIYFCTLYSAVNHSLFIYFPFFTIELKSY